MPKLPRISGHKLLRALGRAGFVAVRQRGSHVVMKKGLLMTSVPMHSEIKPGTLRSILKQTSLTADELRELL